MMRNSATSIEGCPSIDNLPRRAITCALRYFLRETSASRAADAAKGLLRSPALRRDLTMGRLDGKIALIAGGGADGPPNAGEKLSIGNGRATAIMAAREGAVVMAADLNLTPAQQTPDAIKAEGGNAAAVA